MSERNGLLDVNGLPTKQAIDRLMAAVFQKAYNDEALVNMYAAATDPEVKNILNAMAQAAGTMSKLENQGALDIRDAVTEAAGLAVNAKRNGLKLSDLIAQQDITTNPDAYVVAQMFADNPRSAKRMGEILREVANFAYSEATKPAEDMFGEVPRATRQQVLEKFNEGRNQSQMANQTGDLFVSANDQGGGTDTRESRVPGRDETSRSTEPETDRGSRSQAQSREGGDSASATGREGDRSAGRQSVPRGQVEPEPDTEPESSAEQTNEAPQQTEGLSVSRENSVAEIPEGVRPGLIDTGDQQYGVADRDNGGLKGGDKFQMVSGRVTTPFPKSKVNLANVENKKALMLQMGKDELVIKKWAFENALNEAIANKDTLRQRIFQAQLDNLNKTKKEGRQETVDSNVMDAHFYLWEYQPTPTRKIARPLESRREVPQSRLNELKEKIIDFARKVRGDRKKYTWMDLMPISDRLQNDLKALGIKDDVNTHVVDSNAIIHIENKHGNVKTEKSRGQIAIGEKEYSEIVDVLTNYDEVALGEKTGDGKQNIIFRKKMTDGKIVAVEEVRRGRGKLALVTMWKHTPADNTSKEESLPRTSETTGVVFDSIISPDKELSKKPLESRRNNTEFTETAERIGGEPAYQQAKSSGKTDLSYEQWVQVRTPSFKNWFGDWENDPGKASKVVNPKTGEPLVVYHGSPNRFTEFTTEFMGSSGTADGQGHYFTTDKTYADGYAKDSGNTMALFLNIRRVLDSDKKSFKKSDVKKIITSLDKHLAGQDDGVDHPYLSNFGDVEYEGLNQVTNAAVENEYDFNDNDVEIVGSLINGSGSLNSVYETLDKLYGPTGIIAPKDDGQTHYIVGLSNQVKSATDNVGTFDKSNRNILESRTDYQRDLMVTHNMTAENILHANKMDGIPFASLAITKQQNPLSGFGEVTLIGDRNHVDPKGANRAKVFGSDIYSPRYPTVYYEVFKKDSDNLYKRFSDAAKELEYSAYDYEITDRIKERGLERGLLENHAVMYQFLKDNNIKVDIVYDEVTPSGYEDYQSVKDALARHQEPLGLFEDNAFYRDFAQEMLSNAQREVQSTDGLTKKMAERKVNQLEELLAESNIHRNHLMQTHVGTIIAYQLGKDKQRKVDRYGTVDNLRKAISAHEQKFHDYVQSIANNISVKESIYNGTDNRGRQRYIAHTLENVVKKLKKEIRGGESFDYGLGSVRAKVVPQFKSIQAIQKGKDRLLSSEDFTKVKEEIDAEVENLAGQLDRSYLDAMSILSEAASTSPVAALSYADIERSPQNIAAITHLLRKLESMPTEYFEVKAKDVTQFSDFVGAVIPNDLPQSARKVLEDAGLRLFEHNGKKGAREEAITNATNTLDRELGGNVLFSRTPQETPKAESPCSGKTSKAQLQGVIDQLGLADKNLEAVQVHAVKDAAELKRLTGYDMRSDSEGLYFPATENPDGTISPAEIYLIGDHISDERRAMEVLEHELVGHFGMESLLGSKFAEILADVKRLARAPRIVSKKYLANVKAGQKYYATLEAVQQRYPDYSEADQLREVLARMAETRKQIGLLNKVYRQIRQFLQSIGLTNRSLKDIEYMVNQAAKRLREGNSQRALSGAVMASRALESRTQSTQATYEKRIDELLAKGGKANLQGVNILDTSDVLDLLKYGNYPVRLDESKVVLNKTNRPEMTAAQWKKVPEWIEDPAVVMMSKTHAKRLVFVPDVAIDGAPVYVVIEPNHKGLKVHALINGYAKDGNPTQTFKDIQNELTP